HRRSRRGGRTAHRAEPGAGRVCGHGDAATETAQPCVGGTEQVAGQAATRSKPAHENEHTQDRQIVVRELRVGEVLELVQDDHRSRLQRYADDADEDHRIGDRHANRDQCQKPGETRYPSDVAVHDRVNRYWMRRATRERWREGSRSPRTAAAPARRGSAERPSTAAVSARGSLPDSAGSCGSPTTSAPAAETRKRWRKARKRLP